VTGPKLTCQGSAPLRPSPSLLLTSVPEVSEQPSSGGPSEDGAGKAGAATPPHAQGAAAKQEATAGANQDKNPFCGNGRTGGGPVTVPSADDSDSSPYAIFAAAAGAQHGSGAGVKTGSELHAGSNGMGGQPAAHGTGAALSTGADATAAAASNGAGVEAVTELDGGANPYSRFLM